MEKMHTGRGQRSPRRKTWERGDRDRADSSHLNQTMAASRLHHTGNVRIKSPERSVVEQNQSAVGFDRRPTAYVSEINTRLSASHRWTWLKLDSCRASVSVSASLESGGPLARISCPSLGGSSAMRKKEEEECRAMWKFPACSVQVGATEAASLNKMSR